MFKVQYLIYIYISLCVAMMIFNIFYMIYNNRSKRKIQKRNKSLIRKIDSQIILLESGFHVSLKHKKYLEKKLKRVTNLNIFEEALEYHNKTFVEKYIEENKAIFQELCKTYIKKDTIAKSYFAYIIGKYRIGENQENSPSIEYLFEMLEEEELYCIDNGMMALYKLGNLDNIIKAIKIINKKESYKNTDMILKGMLTYEGNQEELAVQLWNRLNTLNDSIKISLIKYITAISEGEWNDAIYGLLTQNTLKKDIKIAIIKYFGEHYDERIKEILYKILQFPILDNIEYIITAIEALKNYPGEDTIQELKEILQKEQWNIQVAASETLNYLGVNYIQLIDIYNGENKKAREILKYISNKPRSGATV